jgi:hypothetical protein
MSTPLVAGAAALVRERLMEIERVGRPSAALVKAVLLHTATDLYPGQFGEVGQARGQEILSRGANFDQGYGRVDVEKAISGRLFLVDDKAGVKNGDNNVYETHVPVTKVTLVYTDAPGSPTAAKALVNDLDLIVETNGRTYSSESTVNNTEQVVLPQVTSGLVKVTVRGTKIPMGKRDGRQPFALVFSSENE